jgi:hypothetical protein
MGYGSLSLAIVLPAEWHVSFFLFFLRMHDLEKGIYFEFINLDYSRVEVAADSVAKSVANVAFLFQAKG